MTGFDPPRCSHCGEIIGVYEPLVVRSRGEVRETSLAAAPELPLPGTENYHLACWLAAEP